MKKITMLFAAVVAMFGMKANAQLVNDTEGWTRVEASFAVQSLGDNDPLKTKGFELGYIKGINLTTNLPLFLELGGQLAWTHKKDSYEVVNQDIDIKYTFMSLAIPVNVAYKFAFSSSDNFTIVPFVGPNFKFNLIGKEKVDDEKISYFDEDDMGKDNTARRFQVGLNLGVGVNISQKLYVGYRFQPDFMHYFDNDEAKSHANYITLGINF